LSSKADLNSHIDEPEGPSFIEKHFIERLIANRNANKQIADGLSIAEASEKGYVANILSLEPWG
jgi:hypothetical protein